MAVKIDLDLNAADATGKIGAVAASLKGLEQVANDIDIDFDADIGDITDEIEAFSEALEGVDVNLNSLADDVRVAAKELDNAEVTVSADKPGGSTGDGDSTGGDPPIKISSGFEKAAARHSEVSTDGGVADSLSRHELTRRLGSFYGTDVEGMMDDKSLNWMKQDFASYAKGKDIHLSDEDRPDSLRDRMYGDSGFGLESFDQQQLRRQELSAEELRDIAEVDFAASGGSDSDRRSSIRKIIDDIETPMESLDGFGSKLRKFKPTMGKYMQLLAALIPIAVALGTQLLGVAAAMGSVAVAGGAIMGLGLLGHGESMEESFAQAQQQLQSLKQEMFEEAQPTMQQFAPIQSRMFDAIPGAVGQISEEMQGLAGFEGTLFQLGSNLTGGVEEFFAIINRNGDAISDLTTTFGGLIGSGLLEFFEWLIQAASENQALLISLGRDMMALAATFYNVSMAVAKLIETLSPIIDILYAFSTLLNNDIALGLLTFIGVSYLTAAALSKMGLAAMGALSSLGIFGSGTFIGSIIAGLTTVMAHVTALIMELTALQYQAALTAAALALTGIGLIAVGAGAIAAHSITSGPDGSGGDGFSGGGGSYGGGGKSVYNDNRQYHIETGGGGDYASQKATEDVIKDVNETSEAQSLPPVGDASSTSDGN